MRIPSGFAQVNLKYTGTGVPNGAEVTFGIAPEGLIATPQLAAEAVDDAISDGNFMSQLSNAVTISSILVKFGPNEDGPAFELSTSRTGTDTNPIAPPNVALLVTKQTALGGRHGRGRMYLPGIAESLVDAGGFLSSTTQEALQTHQTTFLSALDTNGVPMVLLHNDLTTPTVVTSLQLQRQVATQRQRLRR